MKLFKKLKCWIFGHIFYSKNLYSKDWHNEIRYDKCHECGYIKDNFKEFEHIKIDPNDIDKIVKYH